MKKEDKQSYAHALNQPIGQNQDIMAGSTKSSGPIAPQTSTRPPTRSSFNRATSRQAAVKPSHSENSWPTWTAGYMLQEAPPVVYTIARRHVKYAPARKRSLPPCLQRYINAFGADVLMDSSTLPHQRTGYPRTGAE